eukprot:15723031-Heterocapsa_arctica.AAC.1
MAVPSILIGARSARSTWASSCTRYWAPVSSVDVRSPSSGWSATPMDGKPGGESSWSMNLVKEHNMPPCSWG